MILLHVAVCNDWFCTCDLLKQHHQRKFNLLYCKCVKLNRADKEWKLLHFEVFYNFGDFSFLWDYVKCRCVSVKLHVLYKMYFYFIATFQWLGIKWAVIDLTQSIYGDEYWAYLIENAIQTEKKQSPYRKSWINRVLV